MPKRKHAEYLEGAEEESDAASGRAHRKACSKRLEKGKKEVVQGLKLAAAFERQKQGRRKKTAAAKGEPAAVDRLEREYAVLKTLELPKVAEQHLRKTISRVKSVNAHAAALPQWILEGEKETHSNEALNVLARLYKAPAVKKVVDQIIQDLKRILGVGAPTEGGKDSVKGQERLGSTSIKPKALKDEDNDVDMDDLSDEESDSFAGFKARIAGPSSGEESDEESDGKDPIAEAHDQRIYSGSESDSDSDSVSDSSSPKTKRKSALPSETPTSKPAKSTFLPSLTMGGYMSGSESEASDLDEQMAPKKNRRGQRARQQIWEKKFGEKAKHLEKQKGDERSKGWDPKRGATLDDDRNRKEKRRGDVKGAKKEGRSGRGKGVESANGANAVPVVKKKTKRDDAGSLHPSWLAAKAAKEKKMNVVPTGKKIVFD